MLAVVDVRLMLHWIMHCDSHGPQTVTIHMKAGHSFPLNNTNPESNAPNVISAYNLLTMQFVYKILRGRNTW